MLMHADKVKYAHAVATFMAENAENFGEDPGEMYVLGLLHNVGEISKEKNSNVYGARLLASLGYRDSYEIRKAAADPRNESIISKKLALLWFARMHTKADGSYATSDEVVEEVKKDYGSSSRKYHRYLETVKWLKENGYGDSKN